MEEQWKDIPLLSRYQISSLGRVKSKQRTTKCNKRVKNLRWATYEEQQSNKIVSTGQAKIPVKAIDKSGNVYYYDGVIEASKALDVDTGTICKVLSNKYINKTGGGYYFEKN